MMSNQKKRQKMSGNLCDTGVTIDAVLKLLNKHFNTDAKLKSHEATAIGDGHGFLSTIVRIKMAWEGWSKKSPSVITVQIYRR